MLSEVLQTFEESMLSRIVLAVIFFYILGNVFLRYTRKAGKIIFTILTIALIIIFQWNPLLQIIFTVALIPIAIGVLKKRDGAVETYQEAAVRMEGGGIKRGLSPAEAGILLGRPFNVTLAIAIFGMLHKRILKQVAHDPLIVEVESSLLTRRNAATAEGRAALRRKAAQVLKATIHPYEELLLELLEQEGPKPIFEIDFGIVMRPFVRSVVSRLGGFGLEESRAYYAQIIERAPLEARAEGKLIKDRERVFDRNFGWILLGTDYDQYLDDTYQPAWLRSLEDKGSKLSLSPPFAQWASDIMTGLKTAIPETVFESEKIFEGDLVSTALMDGILKATYFG